MGNKNIYKIQTYNSIMCGYFCIGFTDSVLKGKSLLLIVKIYFFLMVTRRMIK